MNLFAFGSNTHTIVVLFFSTVSTNSFLYSYAKLSLLSVNPGVSTITANTTANVHNTVANTTTNISVPSTTTNRVNTTQTLPQTGVTDGYVVAILVTVCAISAIYAYRKIRDYNIKD